MTKLLKHKFYL